MADYLSLLQSDAGEVDTLVRALAIQVGWFFRDALPFALFEEVVLPDILDAASAADAPHLAVWSAGCGRGEEIYSVAMLLRELLGDGFDRWGLAMYGTDIDSGALDAAREGVYPVERVTRVPAGMLERHFSRDGIRSTVVSTQLPVKTWHKIIGEPTIADAILDRLVHNAHRIELTGKSMRPKDPANEETPSRN